MQLLEVTSPIPAPLSRLPELAANLFLSWHRPARALFQDLDPELWEQVGGNPRLMLRCIDQSRLERAARDSIYIERYAQVVDYLDNYVKVEPRGDQLLVAYFCAEYGFHESFPIYSGGLGIRAGDYCKAASDERLNFIAVGLLYRQGYFTQRVDGEGVGRDVTYREFRDFAHSPVWTRQNYAAALHGIDDYLNKGCAGGL